MPSICPDHNPTPTCCLPPALTDKNWGTSVKNAPLQRAKHQEETPMRTTSMQMSFPETEILVVQKFFGNAKRVVAAAVRAAALGPSWR